jgi:hypothetical protein
LQVIRNLALARDAVGALASQAIRAFARRVLRTCRGNLEDVNQGAVFNQFMQQHNIQEDDFEPSLAESMRVRPGDYDWMNQLLGSNYASFMPVGPLYRPESAQLSQGVWNHGESSNQGVHERGESSIQPPTQEPYSQVEDPTQGTHVAQEQRPRRQARPRDAFTPSAYDTFGRGRNRGRGRN